MESLQERKRKNSESGCVADRSTHQSEECTSEPPLKSSKTKFFPEEFFSQEKPWPKCLKLNNLSLSEISMDTEKIMSQADKECSASTSGVSSEDSDGNDEESTNQQSLEPSNADATINKDDEIANKVSTNNEKVISVSSDQCSVNSSGFISMDCEKNNEKSTKSLDLVNTSLNKDDEKSSDKILTDTKQVVSDPAKECSANSSEIISVENKKTNEESTKLSDPVNTTVNKNDEQPSNKELPADSSVNILREINELAQLSRPSQQSHVPFYDEFLDTNNEMTEAQRRGYVNGMEFRQGIDFFLENGYFKETFIKKYNYVYKMFIDFFVKHLKHLTPIKNKIEIIHKADETKRITDTIFKDDDGRNFLYLWTTTQDEFSQECTNKMSKYLSEKANVHRYVLEKPENGYHIKISDAFVVRFNNNLTAAQLIKVNRINDEVKMQEMLRIFRESRR